MVYKTSDLSPEQKSAIKALVGREVGDDEAVSIRVIEPQVLLSHERCRVAEQLRKYFAEVDARRQPGSPTEAEEILTEGIRSSRPGYRLHQ